MGVFKKSCYTNHRLTPACDPVAVQPDPSRFVIEHSVEIGDNLVAIVKYVNCTNFEGEKVLVFKDYSDSRLRRRRELDPHFSKSFESPFARFTPTEAGWIAACKLAEII